MITSNNYCKIRVGGGNSLSGNMQFERVVVNFLLQHNGLGAICAWEVANLRYCFFLILFIPILFNYLNVPAFKGVMRMESCFLRYANCACWEWFSINFTGVAGALCARECCVKCLLFYYLNLLFELFKQNMSARFTPRKTNISLL